jgi:NADPH:quinone reductase-like Zn-dependent oxidoreductase
MPKAVQFSQYGDISVLEVKEVPNLAPKSNEILVKVKASGLNPGEAKIRDGAMSERFPATFPSGQGTDFAGVVDMLGESVTGFKVGDEVAGYTHSRASQAEYVISDSQHLAIKPANVSWEVAGSLFVAGTTAYAAVTAVNPTASDVVVVSGAAGGVGGIAAQLAHASGATVIGIARPNYHEWLISRGITPVSTEGSVADNITDVTDHVNAFIDTAGHGYVKMAVGIGVDPDRIDTIIDFQAASQFNTKSDGSAAASSIKVLRELLKLISEGEIEVRVARTFPLKQVREAYDYLGKKHDIGKVVLIP